MATAYTPGLTVSADHVTIKHRRLPVAGEVLVKEGQEVQHDTVVARTELPGDIETVRLADRMQLDPDELAGKVRVQPGGDVQAGQLLAESPGIFGFFRSEVRSPVKGKVEFFTEATGHLGIRRPPTQLEVKAYIAGTVVSIQGEQGVSIRTRGAFIQGIFGVGGERHGEIRVLAESPDSDMAAAHLAGDLRGEILVGGAHTDCDALKKAADLGAVGVIVGGINDSDLSRFLGYDIGVAITGDEDIPLTLILTEGFGRIRMAGRAFELFKSLEGRFASMNGATQIRAGAMRPEVVVSHADPARRNAGAGTGLGAATAMTLRVGTPIRAVRQPYFGQVGTVSALPLEPVRVASGAVVRVLRMKLADGAEVVLPRSNVEILEAV
jgi:hypothetical protein